MVLNFFLTHWWLIFAELNTAISCRFISSCNNMVFDKLRRQPSAPLSYHIIMFCFYYHLCTQGQMRWNWRDIERKGGVPIKCKSITYRKQSSLAQVERKLEKSWWTTHKNITTYVHTHGLTSLGEADRKLDGQEVALSTGRRLLCQGCFSLFCLFK